MYISCISSQFDCYRAPINTVSSWVDGTGQQQSQVECECSKQENCHPSAEYNVCNCDTQPSYPGWLQDTVKITDKAKLPITGYNYGYLRGEAKVTIGKLFCQGGPDLVDVVE